MLRSRLLWALVALVIVILVVIVIVRLSSSHAAPAYVTAPAQYADIHASVNETGTVNPVNEVNVGTQVSGTIESLYVDYNSKVKKGQTLAVIDPTLFRAALAQANASYAAAQFNAAAASNSIDTAFANVDVAQANLAKAVAQASLSQLTVQRDKKLLAQGFIAQSQLDVDATTATADQTGVAAAKNQVAASLAQYKGSGGLAKAAQAQAVAANGQVQSADYNLTRAIIQSPIDGVVVSRNVSVGQTVAASFQTPTLFIIASNLNDMQVDASVDEADVGQLSVGQSAQISVPAYPNVVFPGTVEQIRVNPIVTNNVVTYDAVIKIHDASARLKPGMTANIIIDVATRKHVLTVPAAALLYRPQATATAPTANTGGAPGSSATLWVLKNNKPKPVTVTIGYNDNQNVEIRSVGINNGDRVVEARVASGQASARPGMFGGR
jgi:HlyD family secretion protein